MQTKTLVQNTNDGCTVLARDQRRIAATIAIDSLTRTSTVAIDYFDTLPPELILVLSPSLSTFSLNALASTCRLFNQILQRARIQQYLPARPPSCSCSKPHSIRKLPFHPHSIHPDPVTCGSHSLFVATSTGNTKTARLLFDAGTSLTAEYEHCAYPPLHLAAPYSLDEWSHSSSTATRPSAGTMASARPRCAARVQKDSSRSCANPGLSFLAGFGDGEDRKLFCG
jgi:hypothetical protein